MKVEVGKMNGLVTYMEVDEDEQMSLSSRDSGLFKFTAAEEMVLLDRFFY